MDKFDTLLVLSDAFESLAASKKKRKGKAWKKLPKGWSRKTLTNVADKMMKGEHPFASCVKKMKGKGMKDPNAFCASLKDIDQPGWREREAKKRKKKKGK